MGFGRKVYDRVNSVIVKDAFNELMDTSEELREEIQRSVAERQMALDGVLQAA